MSPYFYVKRVGPCATAPAFRHPTLINAKAEAERLARKHPGVTFEILKCVAVSRVTEPAITFYFDGEAPEPSQPGF